MSEKEKQGLHDFAAALDQFPEVRAFADGYKAGREARIREETPSVSCADSSLEEGAEAGEEVEDDGSSES